MINFPTDILAIENRIRQIDPVKYSNTRNHKDGAVTHLSPYISRGVISTRQVYQHIQTLDLPWYKTEKLIQELAWRDYWQQVWVAKKENIRQDLKNIQTPISNYQIPKAILEANTGIEEVDIAIKNLYTSGYMHNHMRMYVASICCNIANSHWLEPAKWMYSHLLDGDLASNFLSWQWVSGAFSNKKYYANQNNINNFFKSTQQNTFLDVEYSAFENFDIPEILKETVPFEFDMKLPDTGNPTLKKNKTTLIYNYYNIDPYWHNDQEVQRIFLLEPSFFAKNPVNQKCINFAIQLTKNIEDIKIFVGEFSKLTEFVDSDHIIFKEHPCNRHYQGKEVPREWMSSITGFYPSFFSFWKKCKKEL